MEKKICEIVSEEWFTRIRVKLTVKQYRRFSKVQKAVSFTRLSTAGENRAKDASALYKNQIRLYKDNEPLKSIRILTGNVNLQGISRLRIVVRSTLMLPLLPHLDRVQLVGCIGPVPRPEHQLLPAELAVLCLERTRIFAGAGAGAATTTETSLLP